MEQPRIIIIDDQQGQHLGAKVRAILQRESDYQVDLIATELPDVNEIVETLPDLIIPVLPASKERTADLLATLRAKEPDTPLLPIMRSASLNEMLNGLLFWTQDFLIAPLREAEVLARISRLLSWSRKQEHTRVEESETEPVGLAQLIGEDHAFLGLKRKLPLVARSEAPVLLTGETGTGKELCARALHYLSCRTGKPFLPVNCGAIPEELFERELFGHTKGAFTSAWASQPGLVAEAEGGTILLDEIETLSLSVQAKLLRFLQDGNYHALGSPRLRRADIRIMASTNAQLLCKVQEGTFRADLFYRMAVIHLTLPALRERPADIPRLASHFLARYAEQCGQGPRQWSPRAMATLCRYAWPGNVRELENVVKRAVVLTNAQTLEPEDLTIPPLDALGTSSGSSFREAKAQVIAQFEQVYITKLLQAYQGNVTHAARVAKMGRRALGRLIKKYQIPKR